MIDGTEFSLHLISLQTLRVFLMNKYPTSPTLTINIFEKDHFYVKLTNLSKVEEMVSLRSKVGQRPEGPRDAMFTSE